MSRVDIWIAENIANCIVLSIAVALFFVRWRRAQVLVNQTGHARSVHLLHVANARFMLANMGVALAFLGLGIYLLSVARDWQGWVANFIIVGTGFFAVAWAGFTLAAILHYLALNRVAGLAHDEQVRRARHIGHTH